MPVFFGRTPRAKGPTKSAVETSAGELEPVEPARLAIFSRPVAMTPLYSITYQNLGHLVAVLSSSPGTSIQLSQDGADIEPMPDNYRLPFTHPNFAFALTKGAALTDDTQAELSKRGFTSITFNGQTVYVKDSPSKEDFIWVDDNVPSISPTGQVPTRYLNPGSYSAYLSFHSITSSICRAMHSLAVDAEYDPDAQLPRPSIQGYSNIITGKKSDKGVEKGRMTVEDDRMTDSEGVVGEVETPMMKKLRDMILVADDNLSPSTVVAFGNTLSKLPATYLQSGLSSAINAPGLIFKYKSGLAIPDPTLPGNILGKYFLTCLGPTIADQFSSLEDIKTGLGGLRMMELGDAYTHLYKCIEIAIDCQAGVVPFFSQNYYEGCVVMGGVGAHIRINGTTLSFKSTLELKQEFLLVSDHGSALSLIASKFPSERRLYVMDCKTMYDLREICLTQPLTPDDMSYVVDKAVGLRFQSETWVLSPSRLKSSLRLISHPQELNQTHPISRFTLFSRDPVLVALSVFGDSVPSWDIPQGITNPMNKDAPPAPMPNATKATSAKGVINDATWTMVIRKTDLMAACESFRRLAGIAGYRSVASALAKKQGYFTFTREKMNVFWNEMREAYRVINPTGMASTSGGDDNKRKMEKSAEEATGSVKKRYGGDPGLSEDVSDLNLGSFDHVRISSYIELWACRRDDEEDFLVVCLYCTLGYVYWMGWVDLSGLGLVDEGKSLLAEMEDLNMGYEIEYLLEGLVL
jgi:hypothetical protein